MFDNLNQLQRTDYCGNLSSADIGRSATLMGWVHKRRDLGGLILSLIHI